MEDAKEYTDIIGGHGRFQLTILMFCIFCASAYSIHNYAITFYAPNIDYWCARPEQVLQKNISVEDWRNSCIPIIKSRKGVDEYSHCSVFNCSAANVLLQHQNNAYANKCNSWEYDHTSYRNTIVDKWDLVCDREWLVGMSKTIFMIGCVFGSVINGQLSDRFGRRKIHIYCIHFFLTFSFLALLSPNIIMFMVCRFLLAFGLASILVNSPVVLAEIVSSEYRAIYCFAFKFGPQFTIMLMPLLAWLIPDWFWLHLTFTFPYVSLLCVFWVLPDTPRWLLANGKFADLEKLLLFAAKKNRKSMEKAKLEISDFIAYHSQEKLKKEEKEERATVLDLLRPTLRKNTIIIFFSWFINSYNYYVLTWNTNDLGGDPYWNFFFVGAIGVPEIILIIFLSRRIGNRRCLAIANIMSGISLIVLVCIPVDKVWPTILLSIFGIFFSSGSFHIGYVYTPEIYPTLIRNAALGSSATMSKIGAILSPFVHQLADVTYPWVPLAVPGALSIFSGFSVLLLPETKGKSLTDRLT